MTGKELSVMTNADMLSKMRKRWWLWNLETLSSLTFDVMNNFGGVVGWEPQWSMESKEVTLKVPFCPTL
jgi:hypothetical protein